MSLNDSSPPTAERLALAGRRFDWLFHHSPNLLVVLAPDGRVLEISDSVQKILGYPPAEITGKSFPAIVIAEDRPVVQAMMAGGTPDAPFELFEFRVRHQDGTIHFLEAASSDPIAEPGLDGVLITARDVTVRRELQRRLLRAQRLETIGSLAGGVAHDLNNILAPILMAVELIRRRTTDQGKLKMLRTIELSAHKGRDIVKQVLTFARGHAEVHAPVTPAQLIKEAVDIVGQTFPPGIFIHQQAAPDGWPVHVDAAQLHQVLMNLMVNARDALGDSGDITLGAENLIIDAAYARMVPGTSPGPYVVFSVADTGAGIPAKNLRRIFDPFFTTKGEEHGTGLGLATVKQIIADHKGVVTVESRVGHGTTFRLHVPAQLATAAAGTEAAVRPTELPNGQGELIVVADDDESIRDITKQTLEAYGYHVRTAANGAAALAILIQEAGRVRVIVTDLAMPIMNGRQLINALKNMTIRTKVVLATGSASAAETRQMIGTDADAILAKPFTAAMLLTTVHALLHPARLDRDPTEAPLAQILPMIDPTPIDNLIYL